MKNEIETSCHTHTHTNTFSAENTLIRTSKKTWQKRRRHHHTGSAQKRRIGQRQRTSWCLCCYKQAHGSLQNTAMVRTGTKVVQMWRKWWEVYMDSASLCACAFLMAWRSNHRNFLGGHNYPEVDSGSCWKWWETCQLGEDESRIGVSTRHWLLADTRRIWLFFDQRHTDALSHTPTPLTLTCIANAITALVITLPKQNEHWTQEYICHIIYPINILQWYIAFLMIYTGYTSQSQSLS